MLQVLVPGKNVPKHVLDTSFVSGAHRTVEIVKISLILTQI